MTIRVSASRVGAVVGCDPYMSRMALWLTLAGQVPPPEGEGENNEAASGGRMFEQAVIDEACRRYGLSLTLGPPELVDPDHALVGHPDAYVILDGRLTVLEVKVPFTLTDETVGDWGPDGSDRVPVRHYLQAASYGHLLRQQPGISVMPYPPADIVLVAAWLPRIGLRLFRIPLTDKILVPLLRDVDSFADSVRLGNKPDPLDEEEARLRWLAIGDKVVNADEEFLRMSISGEQIKANIKALQEQLERIKAYQLSYLKDSTVAAYKGMPIVQARANRVFDETLVEQSMLERYRTKLDKERLKKEQKAAYEAAMRDPADVSEQSRPIVALKGLKDIIKAEQAKEAKEGVPF